MCSFQVPLATRLRPTKLEHYVGQQHLLAPGKPIYQALQQGRLHSMIFWGPPGTGKTTLAMLLAGSINAKFQSLSAVFSGVKDIRHVVSDAEQHESTCVLFIDEIHRFNKAQQDAFLPYIENGSIILIGATTENPSFELNNALLSRCQVYVLNALSPDELMTILNQALSDPERGYGEWDIEFPETCRQHLVQAADGDARRCLQSLEILFELASGHSSSVVITDELVKTALTEALSRYDKQGEAFYDHISVLHKTLRGSDPDAGLYWYCRMLQGGCDPLYIARRLIRFASEDIGNADPRALRITLDAIEAFERLGSPEGELAIAQAIIYLACAPKSNAAYMAFKKASQFAKQAGQHEVPLRFRNSVTQLMKTLSYGKGYRYAHDEPHGFAAGERYFPDAITPQQFYFPVDRGLEIKINDKLEFLRRLNRAAEQEQSL